MSDLTQRQLIHKQQKQIETLLQHVSNLEANERVIADLLAEALSCGAETVRELVEIKAQKKSEIYDLLGFLQ